MHRLRTIQPIELSLFITKPFSQYIINNIFSPLLLGSYHTIAEQGNVLYIVFNQFSQGILM